LWGKKRKGDGKTLLKSSNCPTRESLEPGGKTRIGQIGRASIKEKTRIGIS